MLSLYDVDDGIANRFPRT